MTASPVSPEVPANRFANWATDLLVERLRQIVRGETAPGHDREFIAAAADRLDALYHTYNPPAEEVIHRAVIEGVLHGLGFTDEGYERNRARAEGFANHYVKHMPETGRRAVSEGPAAPTPHTDLAERAPAEPIMWVEAPVLAHRCHGCQQPINYATDATVLVGDAACGYWKPRAVFHASCAPSANSAITPAASPPSSGAQP